MKDKNLFYILGGGILILLASKVGEKIMVTKQTKQNFKNTLEPIAKSIENQYGIKPIITISQSALESRWGVSGLTQKANNLFGFTGESWERAGKPVIKMPTREYIAGTWVTVNRPFRRYASWYDSVKNWAEIISGLSRYREAYKYAKTGDVVRFARAVKAGGYATDPQYPEKVIAHAKAVQTLAGFAGLGSIPIPKGAKKIKFENEEKT